MASDYDAEAGMPFIDVKIKEGAITPDEEETVVAGIKKCAVLAFHSDEPGGAFNLDDVVVHVIQVSNSSTGAPVFVNVKVKAFSQRMATLIPRTQSFTQELAGHIPDGVDYEVWVEPVRVSAAYGRSVGTHAAPEQ